MRNFAGRVIFSAVGLVGMFAPAIAAEPLHFRFTDASSSTGIEPIVRGSYIHGIAWGDYDGDGLVDLFLGTFADKGFDKSLGLTAVVTNQLVRQVAPGRFERVANRAIDIPARCSGAVFADLDNDGDLDLYVSSNTLEGKLPDRPEFVSKRQGSKLYRNDGGEFVDISAECGACPPTLFRSRDIGVFDYDNDGLLDLLVLQDRVVEQEGQVYGSRLFRNLGNLKFADVTTTAGLPDDLWGAGIAIADLNDDRQADFFVAYSNRLFVSRGDGTYAEASGLTDVFDHQPLDSEDIVVGASFGDIDRDGDMDLATGTHYNNGPSRGHLFLNTGVKNGVPVFREITAEVGIPPTPHKAPHPEIQDFDNDGLPDLYWSAWFARGSERHPFMCRGLGVKAGLPRFDVPDVSNVTTIKAKGGLIVNTAAPDALGMVYYVDSPAQDYDNDGRLDFIGGSWPEEPSRLFHNETPSGHWLQVRVVGRTMNRMGVGARVRIYEAGQGGNAQALRGTQEITVNGGYSSGRAAIAHFGLGQAELCDVEVLFPTRREPLLLRNVKANQLLTVPER